MLGNKHLASIYSAVYFRKLKVLNLTQIISQTMVATITRQLSRFWKKKRKRNSYAGFVTFCKFHFNEEPIALFMRKVVDSTLVCFHGQHGTCKRGSLICRGPGKPYNVRYLDPEKTLSMSQPDRTLWMKTTKSFFTKQSISRMCRAYSTNKCESVNRTM